MMNIDELEDRHYCKCTNPKIKITYDDRGERVKYCKQCWKPLKEK
jgi:hypothetical protein